MFLKGSVQKIWYFDRKPALLEDPFPSPYLGILEAELLRQLLPVRLGDVLLELEALLQALPLEVGEYGAAQHPTTRLPCAPHWVSWFWLTDFQPIGAHQINLTAHRGFPAHQAESADSGFGRFSTNRSSTDKFYSTSRLPCAPRLVSWFFIIKWQWQ